MVALRSTVLGGVEGRLQFWCERVGDEARGWSEHEVELQAERLVDRLTPFAEKERLLAAMAENAGPTAVLLLRAYRADPDPGLEAMAEAALAAALALSPQGSGYDRNSPCPCGSGAKWKHCCAGEVTTWSGRARNRERLADLWE